MTTTELAVQLVTAERKQPIGPDPEGEKLKQTAESTSIVVTPVIEQNGEVAVSQNRGCGACGAGCMSGFFAFSLLVLGMNKLLSERAEDNTPEARLSGMIQLGTGIGLAVCSLCCCAAQICAR